MNQQEGLELLQRILREAATDTVSSGMPAGGAQLPYMAQNPPQPDYTGQNPMARDSTASTKCLALDFLQSKPAQAVSPGPQELKAAAEDLSAQAQAAGKQIAGDTSSAAGDIVPSIEAIATITLEVPKLIISVPVGIMSQLLQLLEKFRSS
jgi:hypothetical protein